MEPLHRGTDAIIDTASDRMWSATGGKQPQNDQTHDCPAPSDEAAAAEHTDGVLAS